MPWYSSSTNKDNDSLSNPLKYLSSKWNITQVQQAVTASTVAAFILGSGATLAVAAVHKRYFKRIPNADWVHPQMIARKKWVKGVVTSVGDGDGFRLYHTPGPFWNWPLKLRKVPVGAKDLKDETIHIRLAGVDAPEAAHFGKVAQPFSADALSWLKNEVEGRRMWVQLIRKDQYNRIVSIPIHPPRIPFLYPAASRCVSIRMLSEGLGITYEQSGAEYGRWGKEVFLKYEDAAKAAKRGMWGSKEVLESPAEYKKRHREGGGAVAEAPATKESGATTRKRATKNGSKTGWRRFIPFF